MYTGQPPKDLTTHSTRTPNITSDTHTTQSEPEPERASLLGLPGEIRNQIYAYVVVRKGPIEIKHATQYVGDGLSLQRFTPEMVQPLTMVSRKLRREVQSLLVRENHFKITDCSRFFEPKSMRALSSFRGFCEGFGAELRRISVRLQRCGWVVTPGGLDRKFLKADFTVTKGERLLELTKADFQGGRCGCYVRYLARASEGSIFRFLERLWLYLAAKEEYSMPFCPCCEWSFVTHSSTEYEDAAIPPSVDGAGYCKKCNMFKF